MYYDTVIIGAGQSGLAMGYHLQQQGTQFIIVDGGGRVGDSWRERWDSLHLFTPPAYNSLPGLPLFPERGGRTSKNEFATYLEKYASSHNLPIRLGIAVHKLDRDGDGYQLDTSSGIIHCRRVVVAAGAFRVPYIPYFAEVLDPDIRQLHSSQYRNPSQLPEGDAVVIGAAASGIEIALELACERNVILAGKPSSVLPRAIFKLGSLQWWIARRILTIRTPMGRKARLGSIRGGMIMPMLLERLNKSGIVRRPRVIAAEKDGIMFEDGEMMRPHTIIWCTGYRPDFSWIAFPLKMQDGWPVAPRGVAEGQNGLYFIGMPFQYNALSAIITGAGPDAAYIAAHMKRMDKRRETAM